MPSKRFQARKRGKFTRNTPENTLGLHIKVCPKCRALNSYQVSEPAPSNCHACNYKFLTEKRGGKQDRCSTCKGIGPIPPFIDPALFRAGKICRECGRERS